MTRRDYERIAAALGTAHAADHRATTGPNSEYLPQYRVPIAAAVRRSQRRALANIALALETDNPRFDRPRFELAVTATADLDIAQNLPEAFAKVFATIESGE